MPFPASIIKKKKDGEQDSKELNIGKAANEHVLESLSPEFSKKEEKQYPEPAIEIKKKKGSKEDLVSLDAMLSASRKPASSYDKVMTAHPAGITSDRSMTRTANIPGPGSVSANRDGYHPPMSTIRQSSSSTGKPMHAAPQHNFGPTAEVGLDSDDSGRELRRIREANEFLESDASMEEKRKYLQKFQKSK